MAGDDIVAGAAPGAEAGAVAGAVAAGRTFLLSPASCRGRRGTMLRRGHGGETGARIVAGEATLGEVFAFISGLYFRGKLTYARAFTASAFIITPTRGLLAPETVVTVDLLEEFAGVDVSAENPQYRAPLERDLSALARESATEMVLFGSIATGKYVDVLLPHLGDRLLFPETFIGRGDMSRGGVMLRAAADGAELRYIPLSGAIRRGARPPKLPPLPIASR